MGQVDASIGVIERPYPRIGLGEFLTGRGGLHWWRSKVVTKSKGRASEPVPSLSGFY